MNRFGFPETSWNAAKAEAKDILSACAKQRPMIPYSDLVARLKAIHIDAHDQRLRHFLEEISTEESAAGRGMLTALVPRLHAKAPTDTLTLKLPIQTLSEDLARRIDENILGGLAYPSVASFKVPHGFVRISALPRNAPGKVQTHLLPPPEPRP